MANIVVTSDSSKIMVDFGVYEMVVGYKKGAWSKRTIEKVELMPSDEYVVVKITGQMSWSLSYTSHANAYTIDKIDATTPVSNEALYNEIIALMV